MQLWLSHGSEVSIREQLATQVILAILSEDLAPGQRLPSTRELGRRSIFIRTPSVRAIGNWNGSDGWSSGTAAVYTFGIKSRKGLCHLPYCSTS
jgi:DNA-binding transcriptional MocR family regulator